jgi:hypothetical protein
VAVVDKDEDDELLELVDVLVIEVEVLLGVTVVVTVAIGKLVVEDVFVDELFEVIVPDEEFVPVELVVEDKFPESIEEVEVED